MKQPTSDHPIAVTPHKGRVRVLVLGVPVADTTRALCLAEADYAPVYYIPFDDVESERLAPSDHKTHCPYKGDAAYYDIAGVAQNAVWFYPEPHMAVAAIKGHVAFYPDKVDDIIIS